MTAQFLHLSDIPIRRIKCRRNRRMPDLVHLRQASAAEAVAHS